LDEVPVLFPDSREFGCRRLVPQDCVHHQGVRANRRDFLVHRIAPGHRIHPLAEAHRHNIDDAWVVVVLEALGRDPYANLLANPALEDLLIRLEAVLGDVTWH
jgi:hypothetical protein